MKKMFLKKAVGVAVVVAMSSVANAQVDLGADLELDTDMTDTASSDEVFDQNGRVKVSVSSKRESGDHFVEATGQLTLSLDGEANTDDAYIKFGSDVWDLQMGRFEAANLSPAGKDTLVVHAGGVSTYGAGDARGRIGDGGGQIAFHLNSGDFNFELGTVYGDPESSGDNTNAFSGIRPIVTYAVDGFSVSAGLESINYDIAGSNVDKNGYGITTSFDVSGASVNVNYAYLDDEVADETVTTMGANFTAGAFGLGVITSDVDTTGTDQEVTTFYTAYTVPLLDIDGANVTFALSSSTADGVADDNATAARVRLNYDF